MATKTKDVIYTKPKRQRCSDREAVAAYRRVLTLTNAYIYRNMSQDQLVSNGRDIMTWREIRWHIRSALALTHPLISAPRED